MFILMPHTYFLGSKLDWKHKSAQESPLLDVWRLAQVHEWHLLCTGTRLWIDQGVSEWNERLQAGQIAHTPPLFKTKTSLAKKELD